MTDDEIQARVQATPAQADGRPAVCLKCGRNKGGNDYICDPCVPDLLLDGTAWPRIHDAWNARKATPALAAVGWAAEQQRKADVRGIFGAVVTPAHEVPTSRIPRDFTRIDTPEATESREAAAVAAAPDKAAPLPPTEITPVPCRNRCGAMTSYPTRHLMRNGRDWSCVRLGYSQAEIDACRAAGESSEKAPF